MPIQDRHLEVTEQLIHWLEQRVSDPAEAFVLMETAVATMTMALDLREEGTPSLDLFVKQTREIYDEIRGVAADRMDCVLCDKVCLFNQSEAEPQEGEVLWVQKWEESERGWGTRPDGYTVHVEKEDIDKYVKAIRDAEAARGYALLGGYGTDNVPDEYERPCGAPYQARIDPDFAASVKESDHGLRVYAREYPKPIEPGADQTGWTPVG
jgi:hypothetical protein